MKNNIIETQTIDCDQLFDEPKISIFKKLRIATNMNKTRDAE